MTFQSGVVTVSCSVLGSGFWLMKMHILFSRYKGKDNNCNIYCTGACVCVCFSWTAKKSFWWTCKLLPWWHYTFLEPRSLLFPAELQKCFFSPDISSQAQYISCFVFNTQLQYPYQHVKLWTQTGTSSSALSAQAVSSFPRPNDKKSLPWHLLILLAGDARY